MSSREKQPHEEQELYKNPVVRSASEWAKWWSALIGAVTVTLALIFLIFPTIKPDTLNAMGATLSNLKIEPNVALSEYAKRTGYPLDQIITTTQDLPGYLRYPLPKDQLGTVVNFTVRAQGYERQDVTWKWSLYDTKTNKRLDDERLNNQGGFPDAGFRPDTQDDQASSQIWVPNLAPPGKYFVRIELFAPNQVRLGLEDTPPFDMTP